MKEVNKLASKNDNDKKHVGIVLDSDWDDIIASLDLVGKAISKNQRNSYSVATSRVQTLPRLGKTSQNDRQVVTGYNGSLRTPPPYPGNKTSNSLPLSPSESDYDNLSPQNNLIDVEHLFEPFLTSSKVQYGNEDLTSCEHSLNLVLKSLEFPEFTDGKTAQSYVEAVEPPSPISMNSTAKNFYASSSLMSPTRSSPDTSVKHQMNSTQVKKYTSPAMNNISFHSEHIQPSSSYNGYLNSKMVIPPALPPKLSPKTKLKPVIVNMNGSSKVCLSPERMQTNGKAFQFNANSQDSALLCGSNNVYLANFVNHAELSCKSTDTNPKLDNSYTSLSAAPKPAPRSTFFSQKGEEFNQNNNNKSANKLEKKSSTEVSNSEEICIPNGFVSSRIARFSKTGIADNVTESRFHNASSRAQDFISVSSKFGPNSDCQSKHCYEDINRTGPYDNIDLPVPMYYEDGSNCNSLPPLPPKLSKSAASSNRKTGMPVIPVSMGVTSPPPISPRSIVAYSKMVEKNVVSIGRKPIVSSRSLSAPSSPLLNRKFATVGKNHRHNSNEKEKIKCDLQARSPSPTRSEFMTRRRHLSESLSSFSGGLRKAPSVRSLRDRFGSQSSISSVDSERLEDDLILIHDDSVRQRRKEQLGAEKEKQRLGKILTMCEDFMNQSKRKDDDLEKNFDLNKLLKEISLHGKDLSKADCEGRELHADSQTNPCGDAEYSSSYTLTSVAPASPLSPKNTDSPGSFNSPQRNFRRLVSLERDICCQTSQVQGQVTVRSPHSEVQSVSSEENINKVKNPPRLADVSEIQKLRDTGLEKIEKLQHHISDFEVQLDECTSALEMERALVSGELNSEQELLNRSEQLSESLKDQIIDLEEKYMKQREIHNGLLEKEKEKLVEMKEKLMETEKQLNNCPESIRDLWEVQLKKDKTILEQELKNFEDLEFQTLEAVSRIDEEKENTQRKLIAKQKKMDYDLRRRQEHVRALETQVNELLEQEKSENQRLNMMRDQAIKELQQHREETTLLERKYYEMTGTLPPSPPRPSSVRTLSSSAMPMRGTNDATTKEDAVDGGSGNNEEAKENKDEHGTQFNTNQNSTSNATADSARDMREVLHKEGLWYRDDTSLCYKPKPAFGTSRNPTHFTLTRYKSNKNQPKRGGSSIEQSSNNGLLSRSCYPVIQSLNDSRSSQGNSGINSDLTRCRGLEACSMSSLDSLGTSVSAWSIQSPEIKEVEQIRAIERRIENAKAERQKLLADVNAYVTKSHQDMNNDFEKTIVLSSSSSTVGTDAPTTSSSSDHDIMSPIATSPTEDRGEDVRLRLRQETKKQTRPMTRYLPVRAKDFDLHAHIESCGHSPSLCRHICLNSTSCRGYMMKMGGRLRTWHKRWFVFDRVGKSLVYYSNKHETKLRGMVFFKDIQDVFFDHLKTHKSPQPNLTFCVKCYDRVYYLTAPSPETLRIWMDVIVTGAEGYTEYMKTFE